MKRKKKIGSLRERSGQWRLLALLRDSLLVVLMIGTGALLVVMYYQRSSSTGLYRSEYEGRIVDKWTNIGESQTGSFPQRRLLIKGRDGQTFTVAVNEPLYERAQVGMWIKTSKADAELTWNEP